MKRAAIALALAALLAACGGGSDDPPTDRDIGPPDCRNRPEICQ